MTGLLEETALQTMPLARFADALAAATPAPGGSASVAVPAALAAGLVAMSARLTAQSVPFDGLAYELEAVAAEADRLRAELLELVEADARAFDRVLAARRAGDGAKIQAAYAGAVEPALRASAASRRVLELAGEVAARGSRHVASDAGVAAAFAAASLEAAAIVVEHELAAVEDEDVRRACRRELAVARGLASRPD